MAKNFGDGENPSTEPMFNTVPPTQEQIRLTAMAANAAGDVADAYSYMAEYHLMGGDLMLAINQLELALSVPSITDQQRAKFVARLKEVREWLPKERNRSKKPPDGQQPDGQRSPDSPGSPGWARDDVP